MGDRSREGIGQRSCGTLGEQLARLTGLNQFRYSPNGESDDRSAGGECLEHGVGCVVFQ